MIKIVKAYGQVVHDLNEHVQPSMGYPTEEQLLQLISSASAVYGLEALKPGCPLSVASKRLILALNSSSEPLLVPYWGGTNMLAQALKNVHENRTADECAVLRSNIRAYTISDQDDTGCWVRSKYPEIFYICSVQGWCQYSMAAWVGISGPVDGSGPDMSNLSKEWLRQNIQVGPLGVVYPDPIYC